MVVDFCSGILQLCSVDVSQPQYGASLRNRIKVEEWCNEMKCHNSFMRIIGLSAVAAFFACTPRMGDGDVV